MSNQRSLAQLLQFAADFFQRRAFAEAERTARDVLARFGNEPNALMILGLVHLEQGDAAGAVECLTHAKRLNPGHIHVLTNLGVALRAQGRLLEAQLNLEAAVQIDPAFAPAHNNLGNVHLDLEQREEAVRSYERAVALQPMNADALANLARLAEEGHRLEDAAALSSRALSVIPGHVQASLTRARVRQRQGDLSGAVTEFQTLLSGSQVPPNVRSIAHGYLGECLERLSRYSDAFAQFQLSNEVQQHLHENAFGGDGDYLSPKRVDELIAFMARADARLWSASPPVERVPVFLVGFPRSGTTLLDQILSSHPQITVLEERDTFIDVCKALMVPGDKFDFWADLASHQVEHLRALYWRQVETGMKGQVIKPVFVDKLPLNAVMLPLIHRLFPTAKIILALRDPRDAVLSSFQQRFGMNAAMFQMLRLDTAAAYYDKVFSLVRLCSERLPLTVFRIRYEDLVADFDREIGGLLQFLELGWDDNVRNYVVTAKSRRLNTPSATQVVQPIYSSSVGKWRNYQPQMVGILPVLAPWVAAFGYEA
ncbi:MAG: sulfotransferase [Micropepsaceae bacterium]